MKSNEFSSFSADDDYDTECKQKESSKFDLNESTIKKESIMIKYVKEV